MSITVSILSRATKNLVSELKLRLPSLNFHEVISPDMDKEFKNSEIIIGDFDILAPHIEKLEKVKWIQGTFAGADALVSKIKSPPPFVITRFTGEHFGRLMSEYVITNVINLERDFYKVYENQMSKIWSHEGAIHNHRCIADLTFGIMGVGTIGNKIGKVLHQLGGEIIGYGRRPVLEETEENSYLKKYFSKTELYKFLQNCDYIINVLPSTSETIGLLNGNVLQNCAAKKSVFINIGRGSIINEDDLIQVLQNKWLSAAVLDVFNMEPLPEESPLWKMPQVYITPHVAGVTRAKDVAEQFSHNLHLYNKNEPIPSAIDFNRGY